MVSHEFQQQRLIGYARARGRTYNMLSVAIEIMGITPDGWIAIEQMRAGRRSTQTALESGEPDPPVASFHVVNQSRRTGDTQG